MHADHFDELIGHATIARILRSSLSRPAPAYLFVGQPHLGKRTFAALFARLLLESETKLAHPASESQTTLLPAHPDLILLEPEEGKKQISIEQIRNLRERVALRPISARRIVIFIPCADRLNESGTNALLKVLEEPPADAVFILVAENPERLPKTVLSRSIVLQFTIVRQKELIEGLIRRGYPLEDARSRAANAHGRPGLAITPREDTEPGAAFAESFFASKTLGAKLRLIEDLCKICDVAEDADVAWRDALCAAMDATRGRFLQDPIYATLFGIALVTATRFIGSSISPRVALEAGATRLSTNAAVESRWLFSSHLPRSLPMIYESLIQ